MEERGILLIKTFTWSRDSHGLFDYEANAILKRRFKTKLPGELRRIGHDCEFNNKSENFDNQG